MTVLISFFLLGLSNAFRARHQRLHSADMVQNGHQVNITSLAKVSHAVMIKPSPLVVNRGSMPLVVYLERGFLFNAQVIYPGEAVNLWTHTWGPHLLPFSIVVLVGDENSIPSHLDSLLSFVGMSAVPTAFVAGTLVSVITWGALTGPALALAPMVSGLPAIAGYTLAAADIAAGVAAAGSAEVVSEHLIKKHPKSFMNKIQHVFPGTKYFEVTGGPSAGGVTDLAIKEISAGKFLGYNVSVVKNSKSFRSKYPLHKIAFTITTCGDVRAIGDWRQIDMHSGRPKYQHVSDEKMLVEWSKSRNLWRMLYDETWFGHGRTSLYETDENYGEVPESGWKAVSAGLPLPSIEKNGQDEIVKIMTEPEENQEEI